jgi:hypothetical protein
MGEGFRLMKGKYNQCTELTRVSQLPNSINAKPVQPGMIYFYENWYGTAGKGFFQALLKERGGKLIPPLINNQRDFSQQLLIFQI